MMTLNAQPQTDVRSSHRASESNYFSLKTMTLAVGALGVVFGDIGTSCLYTLKECFHGDHAIALTETNIYGALSLIFWSMTIVVSIKYVTFVLLADHHGEGGIFALFGLVSDEAQKMSPRTRVFAIGAGILGAGLLSGEGIITPAISVLSAVEGLGVATRAAAPVVLPLTCIILLLLFFSQHRGTADIGKVFGPVMAIWFGAIGCPRHRRIDSESPSLARHSSYLCVSILCRQQASIHRRFRIGSPLFNGLRSTLCRSGTLWDKGYTRLLGLPRFSSTSLELFWPGGSSFGSSGIGFSPIL